MPNLLDRSRTLRARSQARKAEGLDDTHTRGSMLARRGIRDDCPRCGNLPHTVSCQDTALFAVGIGGW